MSKLPAILSAPLLTLATLVSCSSPASSGDILENLGTFNLQHHFSPQGFHVNNDAEIFFIPQTISNIPRSSHVSPNNIIYKVDDGEIREIDRLHLIPNDSRIRCSSDNVIIYQSRNLSIFEYNLKSGLTNQLPEDYKKYYSERSRYVYYNSCEPAFDNLEKICSSNIGSSVRPLLEKDGILYLCESPSGLELITVKNGVETKLFPTEYIVFPPSSYMSLNISYNPRSGKYFLYHGGRSDYDAYWVDIQSHLYSRASIPNHGRYDPKFFSDSGKNPYRVHHGPVYDLIWSRDVVDIYKDNILIKSITNVSTASDFASTKTETFIRTSPEYQKYNVLKLQ